MAVFSDIHGNLEAMEAFIKHVSHRNIDRFVCLGDLVGYNANPKECIELVRSLPNLVVTLGNHDAAVLWDASPYAMNREAKEAILWCMEELNSAEKAYLSSLPLVYRLNNLNFSHASPVAPDKWNYINKYSALKCFFRFKERLFFVGHTHLPTVVTQNNLFQLVAKEPEMEIPIKVNGSQKHLFNCGSIGQPRTGSPQLNYLIYDSRESTVTFYSVEYNFELAGEKIIKSGLPEKLASRLQKGV